eukprot:GHRR01020973.1.p1 GENE.GHRR01020973.1~~GHRR01020973.1.p1  ORF type:complete len:172 (+),score=47.57 GHRR01020973.1:622-1137(+)
MVSCADVNILNTAFLGCLQNYLQAMACAANYAWVNRSSMTFLARQAFAKMFNSTPDDLDMAVVYDVSHNIAKVEEHMVDGKLVKLLVHRKGSTRAFPPHHPLIPVDYQLTGVDEGSVAGSHSRLDSTINACSCRVMDNSNRQALSCGSLSKQHAAANPLCSCLLNGVAQRF